jgi:phage terminase small subunit
VGCVVPELERLRLLSRLDGVTLEMLCVTYARWRQHDSGLGYPALTNLLAKLARDCGLAPGARQRLTAPASDPAQLERSIFGLDP